MAKKKRFNKSILKDFRNLINDLEMEIMVGGDRFSPQDFQEVLEDLHIDEVPGRCLMFRECVRDRLDKFVNEGNCSWKFVEDQLRIFMGKYYETI